MPIAIRAKRGLTRRQLLVRSAATIALSARQLARPYLSRAADRPAIACGIQSGDVSANSAVIWARADRAARMRVEYSTRREFCQHPSLVHRPMRCRTATSPRNCCSMACRPGRTFSTACGSKTSTRAELPARRSVGHFRTAPAERQFSLVRLVRRYRGARAGASIPRAAACEPTGPCSTTARTSSSIPAITSMPIARCRRN